MIVRFSKTTTVEMLIGLIMLQYSQQGRIPPLSGSADTYELRMLEDDEDEIEYELPALGKAKNVSGFNLQSVALCMSDDGLKSEQVNLDMKKINGPGQRLIGGSLSSAATEDDKFFDVTPNGRNMGSVSRRITLSMNKH